MNMKTEQPVVEPIENEVPKEEELRIRKVIVGAFEGKENVVEYGSLLFCGTCANTGCSTYQICSESCSCP
jgi:hypothetical protein